MPKPRAVLRVAAIAAIGCLVAAPLWPRDGVTFAPLTVALAADFRASLAAGHWFPQWSTFARDGLGSPIFSYLQPGFYYVASLCGVAGATALFAALGFVGMARRWGPVAGAALVLGAHAHFEIAGRADLPELAAMMLLPWLLEAVFAWSERGTRGAWTALAGIGAAVIVTHPCLALAGYVAAASALALRPERALGGLGALATGVALAAFYALPVLGEWSLVSAWRAYQGEMQPRLNFVSPRALFASASPVIWFLAAIGACRSRHWPLILAAALAFFLASAPSAPLWDHVALLHRMQLPVRWLGLSSVALAALAGLASRRREVVWLVVPLLALEYLGRPAPARYYVLPPLTDVAVLARLPYYPDVFGEWMPRDAKSVAPFAAPVRRLPEELRVTVSGERSLRLPQYWFPSWTTSVGELSRDEDGLLRLTLPPDTHGEISVRFRGTPLRRLGLGISAAALLLVAAAPVRRREALA